MKKNVLAVFILPMLVSFFAQASENEATEQIANLKREINKHKMSEGVSLYIANNIYKKKETFPEFQLKNEKQLAQKFLNQYDHHKQQAEEKQNSLDALLAKQPTHKTTKKTGLKKKCSIL